MIDFSDLKLLQLRITPKGVPDIVMGIRDAEGIGLTYQPLALNATKMVDYFA